MRVSVELYSGSYSKLFQTIGSTFDLSMKHVCYSCCLLLMIRWTGSPEDIVLYERGP